MKEKLQALLMSPELLQCDVISWASPVIAFGNYKRSQIATVGLNPSNKEFVDGKGNVLSGSSQRFPTLDSLNMDSWCSLDKKGYESIEKSWNDYFQLNPYVRWFNDMELIISGTNNSLFDLNSRACHLDLIPFATYKKWGSLTKSQQNTLLRISSEVLKDVLVDSDIKVLVLNGKSVVNNFQKMMGVQLIADERSDWNLERASGRPVKGISYYGAFDSIQNLTLNRKIKIIGYNHNLQSSYGITKEVKESIKDWVKGKFND